MSSAVVGGHGNHQMDEPVVVHAHCEGQIYYRRFRKSVGLMPNLDPNILKTACSVELLTTTGTPVTSIDFDSGFASQASFRLSPRDRVGGMKLYWDVGWR